MRHWHLQMWLNEAECNQAFASTGFSDSFQPQGIWFKRKLQVSSIAEQMHV